MRCLNRLYDHPGECDVCQMKLVPLVRKERKLLGNSYPVSLWPELDGKTALYLRPYPVRLQQAERLLRGAGRMQGLRLTLELAPELRQGLRRGAAAMIMPPQGYAKAVLGSVESVGPGDRVVVKASRPLVGSDWATVEITVNSPTELMVPLEALSEDGPQARVFVKQGETFEPRAVTVTARWERFASVQGVHEAEVVAGSGVFWLEAQWRMDHP